MHTKSPVLLLVVFLILTLIILPVDAAGPESPAGTTYEVGPGKPYANIGDVPWESLGPGDTVLIYWRAQPYKEKWVIAVQATEAEPLVVRGVPNDQGELPVIDGRDATTRTQLDYWNEPRGVVKIGAASVPNVQTAMWIVVENLEIRSGRPPYSFTDDRGNVQNYADNAASFYVEDGQHIILKNCIIHDSGNGIFVSPASRDITIDGNWIYGNGIDGSYYEHNAYTEAIGMVYQFNHFGPLCDGCGGNNLKDRSAGLVVRYNWIEGGNRQLDLVDAEDNSAIVNDPSYRQTFVYGNILIEPDGAGNSQILHYGGDSGVTSDYRKGALYFYNNTVISTRSGNTTLMRLSTDDETADARNNILYVTASGDKLAMLDASGVLHLRNNWTKPGWVDSHSGLTGTIYDDGGNITGSDPGFVDEAGGDYHLTATSQCVDAGAPLASAALPDYDLDSQYAKHQAQEARPRDATLDIGAYEYGDTAFLPLVTIAAVNAGDVRLSWSSLLWYNQFQAWRNTSPYFTPDGAAYADVILAPWQFDDAGARGDAAVNYYYLVTDDLSGGASSTSNQVGEFDFGLTPGQ